MLCTPRGKIRTVTSNEIHGLTNYTHISYKYIESRVSHTAHLEIYSIHNELEAHTICEMISTQKSGRLMRSHGD